MTSIPSKPQAEDGEEKEPNAKRKLNLDEEEKEKRETSQNESDAGVEQNTQCLRIKASRWGSYSSIHTNICATT